MGSGVAGIWKTGQNKFANSQLAQTAVAVILS
jgi:hypothetical protein